MSILIADCPRCGAQNMTLDARSSIYSRTEHRWQRWFEVAAACRRCHKLSILVVAQKEYKDGPDFDVAEVLSRGVSLNDYVHVRGFINIRHTATIQPPDHVPKNISAVFNEGATCLAVECWNAAGTMFRLCVDLATRPELPERNIQGLNDYIRRNLGLRLKWLFEQERLPRELSNLSKCIREDGNDGAHQGTLKKADAEDLLDFTRVLLERLYTEPESLAQAEKRRNRRRGKGQSTKAGAT